MILELDQNKDIVFMSKIATGFRFLILKFESFSTFWKRRKYTGMKISIQKTKVKSFKAYGRKSMAKITKYDENDYCSSLVTLLSKKSISKLKFSRRYMGIARLK